MTVPDLSQGRGDKEREEEIVKSLKPKTELQIEVEQLEAENKLEESRQQARQRKRDEESLERVRQKKLLEELHERARQQKRDKAMSSSQGGRNRANRGSAARFNNNNGEETELWGDIRNTLAVVQQREKRAKELTEQIIALEASMRDKTEKGVGASLEDSSKLGELYREQIRITEDQQETMKTDDLLNRISIIKALVSTESRDAQPQRASTSRDARSSLDNFDGPPDSPGPSPAENKQIRKMATGRTSSQPPRDRGDKDDREPITASRTKITFELEAEVAFKPKIPGQEDHNWIQGVVKKIIGEGKSRRYDVQDPFPDEVTGKPGDSYRSSASSMVHVPPKGTPLQDYEVGKRVLALYPDTTTFYRADVKAMLDGGSKVQLLFEDETAGVLKVVERRYVLDHRG